MKKIILLLLVAGISFACMQTEEPTKLPPQVIDEIHGRVHEYFEEHPEKQIPIPFKQIAC